MSGQASHGHQSKHGFKRHELLSLLITFGVGVVAGGYLYLTGFAPQFEELSGQTEAVYDDLVIVGDVYGGRRINSTPSFQVLNDGTYRYLPSTPTGETVAAKEGTLPASLLREVKRELTKKSLTADATKVPATNCNSFVDGVDYRYTITLDSANYDLDSCGTQFRVTGNTGVALDKLWIYFTTLN